MGHFAAHHAAAHSTGCYIKGKFDTLVRFSDSSYGIVDFKTSEAKPEHVPFYSRQLHAYSYALEHAAAGSLSLSPVSRLGLLCVEPVDMDKTARGQIAYLGNVTWLECPKDYGQFLGFIDAVLGVLEQPSPPACSPDCLWCQYREAARSTGF